MIVCANLRGRCPPTPYFSVRHTIPLLLTLPTYNKYIGIIHLPLHHLSHMGILNQWQLFLTLGGVVRIRPDDQYKLHILPQNTLSCEEFPLLACPINNISALSSLHSSRGHRSGMSFMSCKHVYVSSPAADLSVSGLLATWPSDQIAFACKCQPCRSDPVFQPVPANRPRWYPFSGDFCFGFPCYF